MGRRPPCLPGRFPSFGRGQRSLAMRPSRLAAATASRRVGAAELPQDRGHVVVDGLDRDEEPRGDLLVGMPLGEQVEHLLLAGGEAGGVLAGGPAQTDRDGPGPQRAQSAADESRGRCRAEPLEPVERGSERRLGPLVEQGQTGVVCAPDGVPGRRGAEEVPAEVPEQRLGEAVGRRGPTISADAHPSLPEGEVGVLDDVQRPDARSGGGQMSTRGVVVTPEPGGLGHRRAGRRQPLGLVEGRRRGQGVVQQAAVGLAAAGPHQPGGDLGGQQVDR